MGGSDDYRQCLHIQVDGYVGLGRKGCSCGPQSGTQKSLLLRVVELDRSFDVFGIAVLI